MRTSDLIYLDIQRRFEELSRKEIQENSVIDLYTVATSEAFEKAYQEIENNKNPHIFTKLKNDDLDSIGFFFNMPRKPGEDDETYLYRLMDWVYSAEASNRTAINNALLNLEYASNAEYIPLTNGSGTASVVIIPKVYEDEVIENALDEVQKIVQKIASPSLYVEYIVPDVLGVKLHIALATDSGDPEQIQFNLEQQFREYINSIPPRQYLEVGNLNKIGINEPEVEYFQVLQVFIDNMETKEIKILQGLETKFVLDEIIWS